MFDCRYFELMFKSKVFAKINVTYVSVVKTLKTLKICKLKNSHRPNKDIVSSLEILENARVSFSRSPFRWTELYRKCFKSALWTACMRIAESRNLPFYERLSL